MTINRSEVAYSAYALPQFIQGENFKNLGRFLKLIGVPSRFIKEEYGIDEVDLLPEFSLRKAKKTGAADGNVYSSCVPDLTIIIRQGKDKFLVIVETKVFSTFDNESLRKQLQNQKGHFAFWRDEEGITAEHFRHVVLLLDRLDNFGLVENEVLILWQDILDIYPEQAGQYHFEFLKQAINDKKQLISSTDSYRKNNNELWLLKDIISYFLHESDDFVVGYKYGLERLKSDCYNDPIDFDKREFEVNTAISTPLNRNWFHVKDLVRFLNSFDGFESIIGIDSRELN